MVNWSRYYTERQNRKVSDNPLIACARENRYPVSAPDASDIAQKYCQPKHLICSSSPIDCEKSIIHTIADLRERVPITCASTHRKKLQNGARYFFDHGIVRR